MGFSVCGSMAGMSEIVYRIAFTAAVLNLIIFTFISFHFGRGYPSASIFHSIPHEGPYLLDNHGTVAGVSRRVFATLVWQARIISFSWLLLYGDT